MKCPVCPESVLTITERQGIEIDYCPKCRGVWLDRGELDKIIERADGRRESPPPLPREQGYAQPPQQHQPRRDDNDDSHHGYQYRDRPPQQQYQKRRGGFLSELFD